MADGRVVIDVILDDGQVVKGVANIDKRLGNIKQMGREAAAGIKEIVTALGLVKLASKAIDMVTGALDRAIDRYDTLNNFPRVMQQMGFDADESQKAIQRLSDGIQGLPTTLDSVVKTAQRIAIMTKDLDGAVETTLALNNAFLASGASSADAARGLEQYVQMLSAGTVDLQSWRTLQETMGVALNEVAEAFGFAGASAQNDLYEALKSGRITFDELNEKLIELSNQTDGFAERALTATGGIRTAWTNMRTAVVRGVTNIIGAIDNVLKDTPLQSIENIIKNIGNAFFNGLNVIAQGIPVVAEFFSTLFSYLSPLLPTIQNVFEQVRSAIVDRISTAIEFVRGLFASFKQFWNENGQEILNNAKIYFTGVWETIQTVFGAIQTIVQDILGSKVIPFIQSQLESLRQFWQENGEQIMQAVQNAFQFIQSVVQFIMPIVKFIIEIVWSAIQDIISGALNVIKGLIQVFTSIFTGDWNQLWEGIKKILKGAVDLILGIMTLQFLGGIKTAFTNLLTNGVNIIKNMWTAIVNFFKGASANSTNIVMSLVSRVVDFFRNLLTNGTNIFRNLLNAIRNNMNNVRTAIVNIWNRIISFLKGINLENIGKDIIRGLINGIGSMASAVVDKVKSIGNSIKNGFKKFSESRLHRESCGTKLGK
jgi:tape measure domain